MTKEKIPLGLCFVVIAMVLWLYVINAMVVASPSLFTSYNILATGGIIMFGALLLIIGRSLIVEGILECGCDNQGRSYDVKIRATTGSIGQEKK